MPRKTVRKSDDPNWVETRGRKKVSVNTKLTRKQELFVKELVSKDGQITLREAAINAGYPANSAHSRAYELTNPDRSPHVVAAIRSYRDELDAKFGVTYQRHLRDLQTIRDMALQNGAYSAAVQAEYRRGQAQTIDITPEEQDNSANRRKARKRIVEDHEGGDIEEQPKTDNDAAGDMGDTRSS